MPYFWGRIYNAKILPANSYAQIKPFTFSKIQDYVEF